MSWEKLDRAFKTLINKRTTDSAGKAYYNEFGDNTINIHFSEIWADKIDPTPVVSVGAGAAEEYVQFVLTLDPTVPNDQCYYAEDAEGNRLKDWISDKYGSAYNIHLYQNNGQEIFPTDASDWFFDYQTGILTFNGSTAGFSKPFMITGYRYIGTKGIKGALEGGGGDDSLIKINLFPTCSTPYNKTIQFPIPAIQDVFEVVFNLEEMVVAGKEVELASYSFACSGYHDGDFLNVLINDTIIEDTWYTREVAEESSIGNGVAVYSIPQNSKIKVEFNNHSGTSKILWFKVKLLYNP